MTTLAKHCYQVKKNVCRLQFIKTESSIDETIYIEKYNINIEN